MINRLIFGNDKGKKKTSGIRGMIHNTAIFAALVFFIFCFVSCDMFSDGEKESAPQADETGRYVKKIEIQKKMDKASFFLNEENGQQILTAICYDERGNEIKDVPVKWTHGFSSVTNVIISKNAFSFDVDSIPVQGDYEIVASAEVSGGKSTGAKDTGDKMYASYNFSLSSLDKLKNSLSYSFADARESDFEYDGSGKVKFSSIREFNDTGAKINSASERLSLDSALTFHATGENYLYIVPKDGCNVGEINVTYLNETDKRENVSVMHTDEGGFLLALGLTETSRGTVVLTFHAGTKDERDITITLENELVSLPAPQIRAEPSSVSDGKIVHIFGDNISNSYHRIDGGSVLRFEVTRRDYGGNSPVETLYATDSEDKGPESKDVNNGHEVHLLYSGYYHIKAYLENGSGRISPAAEADVTIEPIETLPEALKITENYPNLMFDFPEYLSELPKAGTRVKQSLYTLKLTNSLQEGNLVYSFKSASSGAGGEASYTKTLLSNEFKSIELYDPGEYDISCYYKNLKCGKGLDYETDYSSYQQRAHVTIKEPVDSMHIKVTKEADVNNQNCYTFMPDNIPENCMVKWVLYENGKKKYVNYFTNDSEPKTIPIVQTNTYNAYECTGSPDNTPLGVLNEIELPSFNFRVATGFSDVTEHPSSGTEETYYKAVTAVNSYVNSSTFYDMYYCINSSPNKEDVAQSEWIKLGRGEKEEIKIPATKGEGTYYVHVQLRSPASESVFITRTSQPIVLEKKKLTAVPKTDMSDKVQEEYGDLEKRVAVIYNVKDYSGRYCRISYSINNSVWIEDLTDPVIVVDLFNAGDEGTEKTISVKCIPMLGTWQKGETVCSETGTISRLPSPYAFITGSRTKNWKVLWYSSSYSYKYKVMPTAENAVVQFSVNDGPVRKTDKAIVEEFDCHSGTYGIKASQHKKGYISSVWPQRAMYGDWRNGSDVCNTKGSYCAFPF